MRQLGSPSGVVEQLLQQLGLGATDMQGLADWLCSKLGSFMAKKLSLNLSNRR